jgi:hypothetical protein
LGGGTQTTGVFLLYSTCGVDPKKNNLHLKNISTVTFSHTNHPTSKPMPTDSPEASGPRKRKLSTKVITNGDPVMERKKKKLETKKQSTKRAPTKKQSSTRRAPATKPAAKPAPAPQPPSIEDEDEQIEDEDHHTSVPPHNGSQTTNISDIYITPPPPSRKSTKKPVITKRRPSIEIEEVFDDESDHHTSVPPRNPQHILEASDGSDDDMEDLASDENKEGEAPEESDEAELGM